MISDFHKTCGLLQLAVHIVIFHIVAVERLSPAAYCDHPSVI